MVGVVSPEHLYSPASQVGKDPGAQVSGRVQGVATFTPHGQADDKHSQPVIRCSRWAGATLFLWSPRANKHTSRVAVPITWERGTEGEEEGRRRRRRGMEERESDL